MNQSETPRIALIHALEESVLPARAAFAREWPEAFCFDVLDTSLAVDLAEAGHLDVDMMSRFSQLAAYAAQYPGKGGRTQGILFTCSAFGPAIDAVKSELDIPVLRPNEAAFEEALETGGTIGLAVTFPPSLAALRQELQGMAAALGKHITVKPVLIDGALAALKAGNGAEHDRLAAEACATIGNVDTLVLGQFSLARAGAGIAARTGVKVITTPSAAVKAFKRRLSPRNA